MKLVIRIFLGIILGLVLVTAKGMRVTPYEFDQTIGICVHLIAVLLVFIVFFQWRRTALQPPKVSTHQKYLAWTYLFIGGILLFSLFLYLITGTYAHQLFPDMGGAIQNILSQRIDFLESLLALIIGVAFLVAGFAILNNASWSRWFAKLIVFSISFGPGFFVTLYTWWVLAPSHQVNKQQLKRDVVPDANVSDR